MEKPTDAKHKKFVSSWNWKRARYKNATSALGKCLDAMKYASPVSSSRSKQIGRIEAFNRPAVTWLNRKVLLKKFFRKKNFSVLDKTSRSLLAHARCVREPNHFFFLVLLCLLLRNFKFFMKIGKIAQLKWKGQLVLPWIVFVNWCALCYNYAEETKRKNFWISLSIYSFDLAFQLWSDATPLMANIKFSNSTNNFCLPFW